MIKFTDEQESIISAAVNWYYNSSEQVFQYSGNPGTGKSFIMNEIIKQLGLSLNEVAPMAYVGAAAILMRTKGLVNAKTIHSWLYEPIEVPVCDEKGKPIVDSYFNVQLTQIKFVPKNLIGIRLIIIDEAGTVPKHMKQDILSRGIKVLVAGDLDQLMPVMDEPAFLYEGKVHVLTKIMRQAENSPIIYLCQRAKKGLPIHTGLYGDQVLVITENEVTPEMMLKSSVMLCGRNSTRDYLNTRIRDLHQYHSLLPQYGEKVICRRNNWMMESGGINLTNGLTGSVINSPDVSTFDGKSFTIDFLPDLTCNPFVNVPVDYKYFTSNREMKNTIKSSRYRYIQNLFEFGYAQTVHLAQGSQWRNGMYFEEYLHPDTNNRLNYTALSRFSSMCIYVKKKRKYI